MMKKGHSLTGAIAVVDDDRAGDENQIFFHIG
jgi:hypothetical protein